MKTPFAILYAILCFAVPSHSNPFHKYIHKNRLLQITTNTNTNNNTPNDGQYRVEWSLSLGGKEFLLQSPFLKAGLEQSIKDFINIDIQCNDDTNTDSSRTVSFYSVEINDVDASDDIGKHGIRRIEGNGKCKGDPGKCQRSVSDTTDGNADDIDDDDDFFGTDLSTRQPKPKRISHTKYTNVNRYKNNVDLCQDLQGISIFDLFRNVLITASSFNYNVDIDVIADLQGSLDLTYNVTFQPAAGDGLDQVDSVDMGVKDPVPINTQCSESQCITQRSVIRNIFDHFEMVFDDNKHECLHQGINCDTNDLVTHIWIGKSFFSVYLEDLRFCIIILQPVYSNLAWLFIFRY